MSKKLFLVLFFVVGIFFGQNAFALQEYEYCTREGQASGTNVCTEKIDQVKIISSDNFVFNDTLGEASVRQNESLGDLKRGDTINISWMRFEKKPGQGGAEYNSLPFYLRFSCGYDPTKLQAAEKLIGSFKDSNTTFSVPNASSECSDLSKNCYCRIWIMVLDKSQKIIGGSVTRPFRIVSSQTNKKPKIYLPTVSMRAGKDYEQGTILLRIRPEVLNLKNATDIQVNNFLAKRNLKLIRRADFLNVVYAKSIKSEATVPIMYRLNTDSGTEYIQPNYYYKLIAYSPNDPEFKSQYSLNNDGNPVGISSAKKDADMDVLEAWNEYNPSKDIIVAVVDSGFNIDHPDLKDNLWDGSSCVAPDGSGKCPNHGWDAMYNDNDPRKGMWHGTFVASIIGAVTDNNQGIAGISSKNKNKLMVIKAGTDSPSMEISGAALVFGIEFAIDNKANILNLSLGSYGDDETMKRAIKSFIDTNGLVITAAGNDNREHNSSFFVSPCDYNFDALLCIASSDANDKKSIFSDYGASTVDIAAPGSDIKGIQGNIYAFQNGTSFASPNAAGVAALVWSQQTGLSASGLAKLLMDTGDKLDDFSGKTISGKRINAYRALTGKEPPKEEEEENPPDDGKEFKVIYPNGGEKFKTNDEVEIKWSKGNTGDEKRILIGLIDYQNSPSKQKILSSEAQNTGSYKFKITDEILEAISGSAKKGDKYKIGLIAYDFAKSNLRLKILKNAITDLSDDYFSINTGEEAPPVPPDEDDEIVPPDEQDLPVKKPLVITESVSVSSSIATFKATVWVGNDPKDVEYWFESYEKDSDANIIESTKERTPVPNGQMTTGLGMNHLFSGIRKNIVSGKVYCFIPYAKYKGADDKDAGFGAELCFPNLPWVITKPATNWIKDKATLNGEITNFSKIPKLHAWFKYYIKGDTENILETPGKDYAKPISGSQRVSFSEDVKFATESEPYCYKACARDVSNPKIMACGQEWCFEFASQEIKVKDVKYESKKTSNSTSTIFTGQILDYKKSVYGIPTDKIIPGFKVYPKGDWTEKNDKRNIEIKWLGPENQSKFDEKNGEFSITVKYMDFESSCYCFKAYIKDREEGKTYYADNEICGTGSCDESGQDQGENGGNNDESDKKFNCVMLENGADWCSYCRKQKTVMEKLALDYKTKLEQVDSKNFDEKVLGNKEGYKFYDLNVDDPESYKKVEKYFSKSKTYKQLLKNSFTRYGASGVPLNLFFKDGKDVGGVNGYLDEAQTKQAIEKYCGKPDLSDANAPPDEEGNTSGKKKWTIMVYMAADNNLDPASVYDIKEMQTIGSNDNFNVIVMYDGQKDGDSEYLYIKKNDPETVKKIGEVNTGDPNTLIDFIDFSAKKYPAEKYMLVLWNHGSGVLGPGKSLNFPANRIYNLLDIGFDGESGNDALSNLELDKAMATARQKTGISKFDIISFDACLMQMVEIADYLKDDAKYMQGSEDIAPGSGLNYSHILSAIVSNPNIDAKSLGKLIVDSSAMSGFTTASLVDLSKISFLVSELNNLSKRMISFGGIGTGGIQNALVKTTSFYGFYRDLGYFLEILKKTGYDFSGQVDKVVDALNSAIVYNKSTFKNVKGLAMLIEEITYVGGYKNEYEKLNFSLKTCWDEFLSNRSCPD